MGAFETARDQIHTPRHDILPAARMPLKGHRVAPAVAHHDIKLVFQADAIRQVVKAAVCGGGGGGTVLVDP